MPDGSVEPYTGGIDLPWSNGFEDGFCGYAHARGYCYSDPEAAYSLVESPTHSGVRAARFFVTATGNRGRQTRCVREGALPPDATYGAWYFLPDVPETTVNWNLMFFQVTGTNPLNAKVWDVSIHIADDGTLRLHMFDQINNDDVVAPKDDEIPELPVGSWVHLEFRWKRALGTTGEVQLFQDGVRIQHAENIQTDRSDSTWAQWYVGNLVDSQTPPESTVYVDDVSIRPNQ
jgi:hypothetical protein